ncbi:hypothetical protein EDC04DRAFT_1260419 [Pisolithus marmoratus]|nr:hypothetical protein EDC04DRAFT_1260419 [Pisolithus marmoratus]
MATGKCMITGDISKSPSPLEIQLRRASCNCPRSCFYTYYRICHVWWRLWQAREGTPHLLGTVSNPSPDNGRRLLDSFGGFGRRYRSIKDEGVHGLSLNASEHEQDDQWDLPSGWAIDFDRANLMLKNSACTDVFVPPEKIACTEEHKQNIVAITNRDSHLADNKKEDLSPSETACPAVSRKSPLLLDWHRLYRDRELLEQRWRDPGGEPHVLKIDGHRDRSVAFRIS